MRTYQTIPQFAYKAHYDEYRMCDVADTLRATGGDTGGGSETMVIEDKTETLAPVCIGNGQADQLRMSEKVGALNCMHDQQIVMVAEDDRHYIARRFTPLECERLQGFPDGWTQLGAWDDTKGKGHGETADGVRYKALGNSIAIPPWFYVLQRLSVACGKDKTMASLFDGIGGFPLIWSQMHGAETCLWASEIEEFPIAVTKAHFPEEE